MTEYTKEFLEELKKLCRDYDSKYGKWIDNPYGGQAVYELALGKHLSEEEYFDD